jgi:uncharacterized membrane protein
MQRTDSSISSRPHTAGAESLSDENPRSGRLRIGRRGLLALPVALALVVPAAPALAQSSTTGTSGYKQEVPVKKQESPTKTEPKSGTAPSKESTAPATTPKASTEPATATTPATSTSESKLPFTGLDLRWVLAAGMLLLASGLSIRLVQRRQRGER